MPKLGKLNLTKDQNRRTFHLPIQQAVFVPSTSGVKSQTRISSSKMKIRVNNVRRFLSQRFGGFTSVKATGGFVLRDGKIVKERVVKVTAFATKKDFKKHGGEVISQVGRWGKRWNQESVSYTNEGDLFIIEPSKSGSKKIMKKVIGDKLIRVKSSMTKRRMSLSQRKVMMANLAKARSARRF